MRQRFWVVSNHRQRGYFTRATIEKLDVFAVSRLAAGALDRNGVVRETTRKKSRSVDAERKRRRRLRIGVVTSQPDSRRCRSTCTIAIKYRLVDAIVEDQ